MSVMNTKNVNAPTAASLLIDAVPPHLRAILHEALIIYKIAIAEEKHNTMDGGLQEKLKKRVITFHDWQLQGARELIDNLFTECFVADLDTLPHFHKQHPEFDKPLPSQLKTPTTFS